MRDFNRRHPLRVVGLLTTLAACHEEIDAAEPTSKGGPNEPGDDDPAPQPSPTTALPTTADGDPATGTTSTMMGTTSTSGAASTSSATSTGEAASTTTPGHCGDGMIDPGETCDDGYQHNSDSAACTSTCTVAVCGDGLVRAGVEQCDHGPNNNDSSYGGCTEACVYGPRCGDGVLQPDQEECDASAPVLEGKAACEPAACRFMARVAFVSETKLSGALGGLALADIACAAAAAAAGLDNAGSFKAWLSDGVATPQTRIKKAAADPGYPYTRLDGVLLADDLADLIAHGPKVPLDVTENGVTLPPLQFAWTNIGADGLPFSAVNHCQEWTSEAFLITARAGKVSPASVAEFPAWKAAFRWTSDALRLCQGKAHLYCFED